MAVSTQPAPAAYRIPLWSRVYGFGSVYGKTVRDSRLAFIIAAGLFAAMALVFGAAISQVFSRPADRLEINNLIGAIPASMVDLFGKPVKLGTMGGYVTWKYGMTFALGVSLWSILALSGTLAGEAGRGSLDFVASGPLGKRRIAIEKLLAHLTMLVLALAILAVALWVSAAVFGNASLGDEIPPLGAAGFAMWLGSLGLFFGGLAWLLAPVLGRTGSAGVALIAMMVAWLANGFRALDPLGYLSPFRWTSNHIPLAGQYDWLPVVAVGMVAVVFLVVGVELFARRDLGVTAGLSLPSLPSAVLGTRGPTSRAFGEQLPRALAWGIGMGFVAALLVSLSGSFADQISKDTTLTKTFGDIFPSINFGEAGGWLTLFGELLFIFAGLAATTFVSKWASDEEDGRLEMLLATPESRVRSVLTGGAGAILAVVVMIALFAVGTALGAAAGGVSATDAVIGSTALGLFGIAVVGVGFAVGGVWRTSIAAEIAAIFVIATYLIDLIAPALKLPDWLHQFALLAHYGQPLVGQWDVSGIVASVAIAVAGIALGAWGMSRRDVTR